MKLSIIVLLVFCATNAYNSPVSEVDKIFDVNDFRNSINEFVEKGKELYKNGVDKILEHSEKVEKQFNDAANDVLNQSQTLFKMADVEFDKGKKEDGPAKRCIEKYEPDYNKIKDEGSYKKCSSEIIESVKNFKNNVNKDIEMIKKRNDELGEKVKQCSNLDSSSIATCFGEKWDEFYATLNDIETTSDNVFDKNLKTELELIENARKCTIAALEKTNNDVLAVAKNMDRCARE